MGLATGWGNLGRIVTPFLVGSMNNIGLEPIIASSVFYFVLGFIPIIFLKETLPSLKENGAFIKESLIEEPITIND